ncbi:MAG: 30S ribosomal protein S20 [Nitrospinae bacterium]|nr:30S ribosomal protein S20 [Nitrospinota bacterium]
MATHKSALKRTRQNIKRSKRNSAQRSLFKTAMKKTLAAVETKDKKQAEDVLKNAARIISKVSSKGVIHKRTASRKISSLAKKVRQLSQAAV